MDDRIVVCVKPTELLHYVHIFSNNLDIVPLTLKVKVDELASAVAMNASKYKINTILIAGTEDYALGIKDKISAKVESCFGCNNGITIDLLKVTKRR